MWLSQRSNSSAMASVIDRYPAYLAR
jgi:hypothetical protein